MYGDSVLHYSASVMLPTVIANSSVHTLPASICVDDSMTQ